MEGKQTGDGSQPLGSAINSPLLQHVDEKGYAGGNMVTPGAPGAPVQPLGEAMFNQQQATIEEDIFQQEIKKSRESKAQAEKPSGGPAPSGGGPSKPKSDWKNPSLNNLPEEQKMQAAETMARLIMYGYERGTGVLDNQLQISQRKILDLVSTGKIDLATPIPYDMDAAVPFSEFVKTWNQQTKGTLRVDQQFKDEVHPVLTRVLAKYGQGLSDEQHLLFAFIGHAGFNLQKFTAQKQMQRAFFDYGIRMTQTYRDAGYPSTIPTPKPREEEIKQEPIVTPYNEPNGHEQPPGDNGMREGSIVIHPDDERYSAVQQMDLKQWGAKENMAMLNRISKKHKKFNTEQPSGARKRVQRKR